MKQRKQFIDSMDDLQRENLEINHQIYQLEVQKLELYKEKKVIDQTNLQLKQEVELDNNSK